ncbi:MAG: 16S rRNA (uracil(1498)-N(3))-methyltransferase [Pseudomonadota bacterium]
MARYRFRQVRLHVDAALSPGASVALQKDQLHYLVSVMRLGPGAEILVFNGRDGEWTATLSEASKKRGLLTIENCLRPQTPASRLDYCFAPLKQARLDYMVQKATEMGAGRLRPVLTQHGQVSRVNTDRMRANAIEACEQCGVLSVPEICQPEPLAAFLDSWPVDNPDGLILFCDEAAPTDDPLTILSALAPGALALLIGPEGGFSTAEREQLLAMPSVRAIPLGPRILRADTAAVAALALVQATLGDWQAPETPTP